MNNQTSTNKNNVIDLFSKKHVVETNNKVDYSLVDELRSRRNSKNSKTANRNNLVVLFPGFCA